MNAPYHMLPPGGFPLIQAPAQPILVDKATGMRVFQERFAEAPQRTLDVGQLSGLGLRNYDPTGPSRWAGPVSALPQTWRWDVRGFDGIKQRGYQQGYNGSGLHPNWFYPGRFQSTSLRTTSQMMNASGGTIAIPAVFSPSSPSNFYRGPFKQL
jgi:hypothetical protein